MDHVAAFKAANPGLSHKEALHQARATYTPVAKPAPGPKKPRGRPRSASPKAKGPCVGVAQGDCTAPCHWVKASARAAAHCAHNPTGRAKKTKVAKAAQPGFARQNAVPASAHKKPRSAAQIAASKANIKKAQAAKAAKRSTGAGYGSRGGRQQGARQQGARQQRAGWLGEFLMM